MDGIFDIAGRHVLVTGASSGLGRHFATVLAAAGARVSLTARRQGALREAVAAIADTGGTARAVTMDVTDHASVEAAFDQAEAAFGPVIVLVNNAGVAAAEPALDMDEAVWDRVIDTNLNGVWLCAQSAGRRMVAHGVAGSIVNIASIAGLRVAGGLAPYAASKAAVVQLTKVLALEWARHRIRVNAIAPGYIETALNREFFAGAAGQAMVRRIPQRRLGQPGELDGVLLLLASDAGSYMTGSVVAVDGGHLVSGL